MQLPLDIQFHNTDRSPALETAIRELATKLERFAGDIVSLKVHVALRDAFHAARRQLQDRVRRRDGRVKSHAGKS